MRFNIMEGNRYAATVAAAYGYDVIGRTCWQRYCHSIRTLVLPFLDMHYHFTSQIHRRSPDGVHWNPDAVRMQVDKIGCDRSTDSLFVFLLGQHHPDPLLSLQEPAPSRELEGREWRKYLVQKEGKYFLGSLSFSVASPCDFEPAA